MVSHCAQEYHRCCFHVLVRIARLPAVQQKRITLRSQSQHYEAERLCKMFKAALNGRRMLAKMKKTQMSSRQHPCCWEGQGHFELQQSPHSLLNFIIHFFSALAVEA